MQERFIRTLEDRRAQIRARWEAFLRIEHVDTPLASPDTLVYLFDQTLAEVFARLRTAPPRHAATLPAHTKSPLLAYFRAGEQALLEALVLAQAERPAIDAGECQADLVALQHVIRAIARKDITNLEGACHPSKAAPLPGGN
jgi:hypothetical protein